MKLYSVPALVLLLCTGLIATASDQTPPTQNQASIPHLSKQTRMDLIHGLSDELIYIRTSFPMGKIGLSLKNGVISPSGADLQQLMALWGPAVKPGDEARITSVEIKPDRIRFEINGGPIKKQKWYQRIEFGGTMNTSPVAPGDQNANPRGTYVDLLFDHYVPDLTPQKFKDLLRPVFDFDAKSAEEAYLDTMPPKVKEAIQNHQVLVGMNREMLIYAKGRPPKKIREKDGETEYEDWIYGEPPQDVDFVRLVGDEVVRVETMKVDGSKTLRTAKEVNLEPAPSVAKASEQRPPNAPSLRRPGEPAQDPNAPVGGQMPPVFQPPPPQSPPPGPSGGPNYAMR
ncbi:MAG: hypothetical protein ABSA29_07430 [Terriglobales bacterium]